MKVGIVDYANLLVDISKDAAGDVLDRRCASVLKLMTENGDGHLIKKLPDAVSDVYGSHVQGGVISVVGALDPASTVEVLAGVLGKHIEDIDSSVDESLIGGVVVRIDNTIIDASVKGKLEALALKLRK